MSAAYKSNMRELVGAIAHRERGMLSALQRGMRQGTEDFRRMMTQSELTGRPGLNIKTGNLKRNFFTDAQGEGWAFRTRLYFTNVAWYAKVHQHYNFDGTIRAKNGKFLAIPLNSRAAKLWPRDWQKGALSRRGSVLGETYGKRGNFRPMYALKTSVFIPKRLHILEYWREFGARMLGKRMMEFVKASRGMSVSNPGYAIWGNR
jgi:hypothetical protein